MAGRGVDLFPTLGGLFLVLDIKNVVCQHWADFFSITIELAHWVTVSWLGKENSLPKFLAVVDEASPARTAWNLRANPECPNRGRAPPENWWQSLNLGRESARKLRAKPESRAKPDLNCVSVHMYPCIQMPARIPLLTTCLISARLPQSMFIWDHLWHSNGRCQSPGRKPRR